MNNIVRIMDLCLPKKNFKWTSVNERSEFQYIDLSSVDRDLKRITNTITVNKETAPSRAKQIVYTDDILFGTTRPLLKRSCIVDCMHDKQLCSTGFCLMRPNTKIVNINWMHYVVCSKPFFDYLEPLQSGVAYPAVSDKNIYNYELCLPPLSEQQAIASELDTIQTMIDGYKAQIADLDKLAKSIFLDMFGDPISNSKKWETQCFSLLFSLKSGDGLSAKQMVNGEYPVYGGNGINGCHNEYNKDGEFILVGRVGAYCGNVRLVNRKFWLTDNAFEVHKKTEDFTNVFLTHLLQKLELGRKANKAAQPVISNVSLKDILVPICPKKLQQQFAAQVEEIEKQKELLKKQKEDAEQLMAERMQYYFS